MKLSSTRVFFDTITESYRLPFDASTQPPTQGPPLSHVAYVVFEGDVHTHWVSVKLSGDVGGSITIRAGEGYRVSYNGRHREQEPSILFTKLSDQGHHLSWHPELKAGTILRFVLHQHKP